MQTNKTRTSTLTKLTKQTLIRTLLEVLLIDTENQTWELSEKLIDLKSILSSLEVNLLKC